MPRRGLLDVCHDELGVVYPSLSLARSGVASEFGGIVGRCGGRRRGAPPRPAPTPTQEGRHTRRTRPRPAFDPCADSADAKVPIFIGGSGGGGEEERRTQCTKVLIPPSPLLPRELVPHPRVAPRGGHGGGRGGGGEHARGRGREVDEQVPARGFLEEERVGRARHPREGGGVQAGKVRQAYEAEDGGFGGGGGRGGGGEEGDDLAEDTPHLHGGLGVEQHPAPAEGVFEDGDQGGPEEGEQRREVRGWVPGGVVVAWGKVRGEEEAHTILAQSFESMQPPDVPPRLRARAEHHAHRAQPHPALARVA